MNLSPFTIHRLPSVSAAQTDPLAAVRIDRIAEDGDEHALWPQGGPCATTVFYRELPA